MKTAIIEVEETKKFKPFKVEITLETLDEAKNFFHGLEPCTEKICLDVFFKLLNHIQNINNR